MTEPVVSTFAPDEVFMRWAWDRIMASTDLSPSISEPAYLPWRDAFWSGDPREANAVVRGALDGHSFRWFWLENAFSWIERNIHPEYGWPYAWRTPVRKTLRLPKSMVGLLADEVGAMVYVARNRANYASFRAHKARAKLAYEAVLTAPWGCPAGEAIARRFAARFAEGDGMSWPPFFPGDRTGVRFDVLKHPDGPLDLARCSIRTVRCLWPISPAMPAPALES